jgi:uncharacterized protein (DUF488 family)
MEFFTIGVYNSTESEFFNKLVDNRIDTFCDIRQRRGVRGAKYSFVNSNRLQEKLTELDIKYGHVVGLAPTTEIRNIQNEIDVEKGELKRERQQLGEIFKIEYKNKIINIFNFEDFIDNLEKNGSTRVVLFCVEELPTACHRSVVAQTLNEQYGFRINHL